ncbi:MAG: flagellar hook-associated protein FlgL [Saccharofermentanales bacterium]
MRITNNVLVNNLKNSLSRNIRSMEKIQNQLATGMRINKPSDDPTGIVESLRLSSRLRENAQFQANVQDALGWLTTTDDTLGSLTNALQRVSELTIQAANGTLSSNDRAVVHAEVEQIVQEVGAIANTMHGDRYIFGGTNTTEEPYVAGEWHHNTTSIQYEIGVGVEIPINLTAEEVFVKSGVFKALEDIVGHMDDNNAQALSNEDLGALQKAIDQVLASRARVGASVNRLEMTKARLEEQKVNFSNLQAEVDGVDSAWVIMQLKEQEAVYRASLAVGARVIMPTLVDFIR